MRSLGTIFLTVRTLIHATIKMISEVASAVRCVYPSSTTAVTKPSFSFPGNSIGITKVVRSRARSDGCGTRRRLFRIARPSAHDWRRKSTTCFKPLRQHASIERPDFRSHNSLLPDRLRWRSYRISGQQNHEPESGCPKRAFLPDSSRGPDKGAD